MLSPARPQAAQEVLLALLQAFDQAAAGWPMACGPGCAVCCTDRVPATTLEARLVAQYLRRLGRQDLLQACLNHSPAAAARPATTYNALARLCLARQEPPQAPPPAGPSGICPLLERGRCQVYPARPLACRVMASRRACPPGGWAEQDPWWVTLGTAFHQLVEQADAAGGFGLLPEALAAASGRDAEGLLICENLPGLPAPAEHQARLRQALAEVFARPAGGRPLGLALERLRAPA